MRCSWHGPLQTGRIVQPAIRHARKYGREFGDLVHNLRGMGIGHGIPHSRRHFADYSPIRENPVRRVDDFANTLYPPFEICESAVFLQERGAWKDESRKLGGLAHKQILDDEKLQVLESLMHLL